VTRLDNFIRFLKPDWRPLVAIPPLDGPLTPNDQLEQSPVIHGVPGVVDLCRWGDALVVAAGTSLLVAERSGELRVLARFDAPVRVVERSRSGGFLVGLQDQGIWRVSAPGEASVLAGGADGMTIGSPTAIAETDDGTIWVSDGTTGSPTDDWAWDLFSRGASGRLIRIDVADGEPRTVVEGLRYPAGLCITTTGEHLLLSEAWSHTVWRYELAGIGSARGRAERHRIALVPDLPGYPGRLRRRSSGGYWLTVFALRTQLTEFILDQSRFRTEMMRTIDAELWVRPALTTLNNGLEPQQAGQMKKLGITKPWAPPRSYGLLLALTEDGQIERSWHSRAEGVHHGVTGVEDAEGGALAVASGSGQILRVVE
jgi:hypothetical protein